MTTVTTYWLFPHFIPRSQLRSIPYRNHVLHINTNYTPKFFSSQRALRKILHGKILINQTELILSDLDKELLCVGLNFILPPTNNLVTEDQIDLALNRWTRSIDIDIHLANNSFGTPKRGWIHDVVKSQWEPPPGSWRSDPEVTSSLNTLKYTLYTPPATQSNTDREIAEAINKLRTNPDIHILKADKGRGTVIWSTKDYDAEALRQLNDKSTYHEMNERSFATRLATLTRDVFSYAESLYYGGHITHREREAMQNTLPGYGSAFYLLPKVHKNPNPYGSFAGRPIVATFTNPVHLIDKYLTNLTSVLLPLIPGSLRDTPDLISRLQTPFNPPLKSTAVIVTADVNSLYPCIPWIEGVEASVEFYRSHLKTLEAHALANNLPKPPTVTMFADLLNFVLHNSYIHFKNRCFFRQLKGTAMGMCISVFFANAYMYKVTKEHIQNPLPNVRLFLRYIDDILVIFDEATDEDVAAFFRTISNEHIEYTIDRVGTSQNFLDLTISIDQTLYSITFAPYWKPTSSGSYIHPDTSHPQHVVEAIPYSQFERLRRNSSNNTIFQKAAKRLKREFILSGYKKWQVNEALRRTTTDSSELRSSNSHRHKRQPDNDRRLILPFHPTTNYVSASQRLLQTHDAIAKHYLKLQTPDSEKIFDKILTRTPTIVNSVYKDIGSNFTPLIKQGPHRRHTRINKNRR